MSKYYKVDNNTLTNMTEFLKRHFSVDERDTISCIECRSLAEKILSSLPTIEVSEDCISREWLLSNIEQGEKEAGGIIDTDTDNVKNFICAAPSVVPKDNGFKDGQKDMLMFLLEGMKNALEKARDERVEE